MKRKTIVKECKDYTNKDGQVTANTTTELYAQGNNVYLETWTITCDEADDWHSCDSFPIDDYKNGIQELIKNGNCLIKCTDLSEMGVMGHETLRLKKISDNLIEIYCDGIPYGNLHCSAEKLVLN